MAVIEIAKIQVRRGQENTTGIPQLDPGEFGWAEDTEHLYIGKRIAEGASSDENSRILTENDYENLFAIASGRGTSVASTSTYRYRNDLPYTIMASTTTTIASKLDDYVSLVDFGLQANTSTFVDIYNPLTAAIRDLYLKDGTTATSHRKILIPAGKYYANTELPGRTPFALAPNITLIGEGSGMTFLYSQSTSTGLFATVVVTGPNQAAGVNYNSAPYTVTSGNNARNVTVEGMTIGWYDNTSSSKASLLYLDNVDKATLSDVRFHNRTPDFINPNYGTAISMSGSRGSGVEQCKNVIIDNCRFENIGVGIVSTGSVTHAIVKDSFFTNLQKGILSYTTTSTIDAPSNFLISQNRFRDIASEAIFVGTSTNRVGHISDSNIFSGVGSGANGIGLTDYTTDVTGAVIAFYGEGCVSINDYFQRHQFANTVTDALFYYNPLVNGRTTISNGAVYTKSVPAISTNITKFAIINGDQLLNVRYKLYDNGYNYSRSGFLTLNIAKPNDSLITGTNLASVANINDAGLVIPYNSGTQSITTGDIVVSTIGIVTGTSVVNVVNQGATIAITLSRNTISAIGTSTNINFVRSYPAFGSVSDYYDYSYTDLWVGASADQATPDASAVDSPHPYFYITDPTQGYLQLRCQLNTSPTNYTMEYQFDIQT
jgi:hypothetical protein